MFDILSIMYNFCAIKRINLIDKEEIMLQVTEQANKMISNFLKDREDAAYIRIFLAQGG